MAATTTATTVSLVKPPHLLGLAGIRTKLAAARAAHDSYTTDYLQTWLQRAAANAITLDELIRTGRNHGWTVQWRSALRHNAVLYFARGDHEYLRLTVDASSGTIGSMYGSVATGPVSSRHIDSHSWIRTEELATHLASRSHADYEATEWVLVVGPGYVERRDYSSPCNYAEYRVEPGTYPVELVDIAYRPPVAARTAYYAIASAPSVKFHEYYVNRVGSASSISENWDESAATSMFSRYVYQLGDASYVDALPEDMTGKAVWIRRADLPA